MGYAEIDARSELLKSVTFILVFIYGNGQRAGKMPRKELQETVKMGGILYIYENVWKPISCGNMEDEKNVANNISDVDKEISRSHKECHLTFTSCVLLQGRDELYNNFEISKKDLKRLHIPSA